MIQVQASPSRSSSTDKPRAYQSLRAIAVAVLIALALAPVANIVAIIAGTGADNLSNDYLAYTGLIGNVLSGSYDWSHYWHDTFYRTHSVALPVFLHIAAARFFHWSIYPELYLGIAMAAVRVLLLCQALSWSKGYWTKWSLLPTLSLLVFSASQISVYAFGDAALTIDLSLLGLAVGVWGLVRRRQTATALLIMLVGGLIASFSWGNGLVSWLILLMALPLLGYRKPWHYAVWLFGFSLSILPYLLFLSIPGLAHTEAAGAGKTVVSLFNWRFVVDALGWPFSNDIGWHAASPPGARTIGWTGLGLAFAGIALIRHLPSSRLWQKAVPALLLMTHGVVSLWQISVFRSLIAAWYTAVSMSFWIGLCALAIFVLQERRESEAAGRHAVTLPPSPFVLGAARIWAGIVLVFVACIYLRSNLTYEDKTDFLFSRSPASASALRNYRCAPTYGEGLLFQWGAGNPGLVQLLALPLEEHRLSVFAPHQLWTLQGDYLLDRVKVVEQPNAPDVIWTTNTSASGRLPWYHFKHLNLLVGAPNMVTWTVDLPAGLQSADFLSAVTMSESAPKVVGFDRVWCKVDIRSEDRQQLLSFAKPVPANERTWQPLKIDLSPYKGHRITIRLSVMNGKNRQAGCVAYQYPRIALADGTDGPGGHAAKLELRPANTDLSPEFIRTTAQDFVIKPERGDQLKAAGSPGSAGSEESGANTGNQSDNPDSTALDLDLSQYSHLWVKLAVPPDVKPRVLTAKLSLKGSAGPVAAQIPLLPDGAAHAYSYDLKLLSLSGTAHLTGIAIDPVAPDTLASNSDVQILGLRFIRRQP